MSIDYILCIWEMNFIVYNGGLLLFFEVGNCFIVLIDNILLMKCVIW